MRRILLTLLLVVLPLGLACADIVQAAAQADAMHDKGMFVEARKLLLDSVAGAGKDQAKDDYASVVSQIPIRR